jgi:hypothetical protein
MPEIKKRPKRQDHQRSDRLATGNGHKTSHPMSQKITKAPPFDGQMVL